MATAKKFKLDVRSSQSSRTNDFGFIQQNDRAVFALCLSRYEKQSNVFKNLSTSKNNANEASYKLALCIAKHGKPFTDGDFIKAAFLECSEVLFDGMSNRHMVISRIKDMSISATTVERRISEMAANVSEQQPAALTNATVFSVALDKSVDINDIPRLAVFVYNDTEIHEELCCLTLMHATTKGEDILKTFTYHFEDRGIDIRKIFAVTTDGTPAMVGKNKGFTKMIGDRIGHPVLKLHCILHQENLCAKIPSSDLNKVMPTVTKLSSLTHRQFQAFLEEVDSAYKEIPLHSSVRWLSYWKILERFVECFDEIKISLSEKKTILSWRTDCIVKLVFLSGITKHLNDFSLLLQSAGKTVMDLYDIWKAFVAKLGINSADIKTGYFRYSKDLKNLSSIHPVNTADLQCFHFFIRPDTFKYSELKVPLFEWMETEDLEMQLIDFQTSSLWSAKFKDL
ncbi:general transcription factor II-I repeat domain-containing protein 2A-like [Penaeus vannamei]|uniref:general transcription factor II-I repeat domain-containing protein 2A-like n=1 Tax=Penaeus vannamei TaxID=6689 RepID=UPI00387F546E